MADLERANAWVRAVAKQNECSEAEVWADMEQAVAAAFAKNDAGRSTLWAELFGVGRMPSVAEFVAVLAEKLQK